MQKEKQLKKFFHSIKNRKGKCDLSCEAPEMIKANAVQIYSPLISTSNFKSENVRKKETSSTLNNEKFAKFERQFEEKKKRLEIVYKDGELNEIIQNFLADWLDQSKKNKAYKGAGQASKSYRAKIDKFIKGLQN